MLNEEAEKAEQQRQKYLVSGEEAKVLEAKFLQSFTNNDKKQRWLKKNKEKGQQRAQKEKALKLRSEQRRLKKLEEKGIFLPTSLSSNLLWEEI